MVLKPLKVTIENLPEDYCLMIEKPLHPKVLELGSSKIPFTRNIYIEADDFRLEDSKDYFRLAPGKTVGLFQAPYPITCTSYKTDPVTGEVVELICKLENEGPLKKPKSYIQWVAEHAPSGSPVKVDETRIFKQLFKSDVVPKDFKTDIASDSLEVLRNAVVEVGFWPLAKKAMLEVRRDAETRTSKVTKEHGTGSDVPQDDTPVATTEQLVGNECVRFQGLRVAYFALDKDARVAALADGSTATGREQGDYLVLNRIVSLKEDSGKT
jgi:glutaminyl-tRNA synthetase